MYLYLWLNINLKFRTMKQIGRNVMCGLCTAVTAAAGLALFGVPGTCGRSR